MDPRSQRSERRVFAEHIELPRIVVTFGRDGLVVTAYLGEVGRLELQGEFHQGVRNVRGGFIGDGVFGRTIPEIHRRAAGHAKHANFPLGFVNKNRDS
jgi:hypothetical protein